MKYISVKFLEIEDKEFSPKILQMIQIPLNKKNLEIVIDWLKKFKIAELEKEKK